MQTMAQQLGGGVPGLTREFAMQVEVIKPSPLLDKIEDAIGDNGAALLDRMDEATAIKWQLFLKFEPPAVNRFMPTCCNL